jgi:hypothetical protein
VLRDEKKAVAYSHVACYFVTRHVQLIARHLRLITRHSSVIACLSRLCAEAL